MTFPVDADDWNQNVKDINFLSALKKNNKGTTGGSRVMDDGEIGSRGMSSSVNEFWNRASETDRSELKSSSDDSAADESESSGREYRDAGCYVDFDEESDEIFHEDVEAGEEFGKNSVDDETRDLENLEQIVAESTDGKNVEKIIESSESNEEKNVELKSSRYVRWDVLASLGLGLWAVLCIVDVLHSEDFSTAGWLFKLTGERKNFSKIVPIEEPVAHVSTTSHFWPRLWKILCISSSGGTYALAILLLIVFCVDPRLRRTAERATIGGDSKRDTRIPTANEPKNSVVAITNFVKSEKSRNSPAVRPMVRKSVTTRLVVNPAIQWHAKILSNAEERFSDSKSMQRRSCVARRRVANLPAMLQAKSRLSEYGKMFAVERGLFGRFRITSRRTLRLANGEKKESRCVVKASASVYLMDASTSTRSVRKIDLEVEEYLGKTRKCSSAFDSFLARIPGPGNFTESPRTGENRTRIITSSPAFKNFLLRLRHNSRAS